MTFIKFYCPNCKYLLENSKDNESIACYKCFTNYCKNKHWTDLCFSNNSVNNFTEKAYKIYSKFYAPFALFVYIIIWRGNIIKHIKFFRNILLKRKEVIDIAIGDGSLSSVALFGNKKLCANEVIAIDISEEMLSKAKNKLHNKPITFVRGDVLQLPFIDSSLNAISCFGGFNSFPSGKLAMQELARCLSQEGIIRGSILLTPETPWKKNLIKNWIKKGYQTEEIDKEKFLLWVQYANLIVTHMEQYGDVLLFELSHRKLAA